MSALAERHHGITAEIGASYAQAAAVCLSRHHVPPTTARVSSVDRPDASYGLSWPIPDERARAGWANDDDATRDGAYGIVLAAADAHLGLVALARTRVRSGADYWLGPRDSIASPMDGLIDLEHAIRLEASGIDHCRGAGDLTRRVRQKVEQLQRGNSDRPAVAGVVAFNLLRIAFRSVR